MHGGRKERGGASQLVPRAFFWGQKKSKPSLQPSQCEFTISAEQATGSAAEVSQKLIFRVLFACKEMPEISEISAFLFCFLPGYGKSRIMEILEHFIRPSQILLCEKQVSHGRVEERAAVSEPLSTITVSVVSSIALVPEEDWDACAIDAAGPESVNPFVSHAFLLSLEESKSAAPVSGRGEGAETTLSKIA